MDDRERIEALVADGRITREEADRLLGVLDDIDQTEQQLGGVEAEVKNPEVDPLPPREGTTRGTQASPPPLPPAPVAAPAADHARDSRERTTVPQGLRWMEVSLIAGDLDIAVDESAGAPTADSKGAGQIELERTEDGYRLGGFGQKGDNFLDRLMSGFTRGETRITIPGGWGLRLNMKAGDVTIQGPLRFLAGHLLAGDLDADEVHGVDLNISAGDIDLGLLIGEGQHRLHAVAGDLNVRLLHGSDARVSGRVNIGDLKVPNGWAQKSKGVGSSFEQTLGQGRAKISLELGTGDLDVRMERARDAAPNG